MILVTGGSGFIGSHTVRALHDLGETSVLVQRRTGQVPAHLADLPVAAEQADVADLGALRAIGARHQITGIVHLAGYPAPRGTAGGIDATQGLLNGLLNIARVAQEWGVRRVSLASTIGVYSGVRHDEALTEDLPLPLTAPTRFRARRRSPSSSGSNSPRRPAARSSASGSPVPGGPSAMRTRSSLHQRSSTQPRPASPSLDLSGLLAQPHLGDGLDLCYVKDTGRAIALLQLAGRLRHRTYNVASGRVTTNADVIAAIRQTVPDAELDLPAGAGRPGAALDITRLRTDTSFEPEYDTARAAADYIAWLRAGHER